MSRTPIEGFRSSNGHGRNQAGFAPVARQSNLIVQASSPVTRDELKKMLLEQLQKDNKRFGLLVDDIQGRFTITNRTISNAFTVLHFRVYHAYPAGHYAVRRGLSL